jgi:hypothetical protein
MLVDETVVDPPHIVEIRISRRDDGANETLPQLLYPLNR